MQGYPGWGGESWVPDWSDLYSSLSAGSMKTDVVIRGLPFTIVDVRGRRSERKKWIEVFDGVACLLFAVDLGEYDISLLESPDENRLTESISVFRAVTKNSLFIDTTKILILNKADVFYDKFIIRKIPLNISGSFPDAPTSVSLCSR